MNRKKNPSLKQFNVRLPANQLEQLRRYAWDRNKSISYIVREVLEQQALIQSSTIENKA